MFDHDVFLDPSVIFDNQSFSELNRLPGNHDYKFSISSLFSPESLEKMSETVFEDMREYYGSWLRPSRRASKSTIIAAMDGMEMTFYSVSDFSSFPRGLGDLDAEKAKVSYLSGWKNSVNIEELWFLASHSSVLSRIKRREAELVLALTSLRTRQCRATHITIEQIPRETRSIIRNLSSLGTWLIWFLSEPAFANLLPQSLSLPFWLASSPILVSFRI